jgi:Na+/H+-dicarboxylate symporter
MAAFDREVHSDLYQIGPSAGTVRLTLCALPVGALIGLLTPQAADLWELMPRIFVRLLSLVVGPLVLTTITTGLFRMARGGTAGRLLAVALLWFFLITGCSTAMGMALSSLTMVGYGIRLTGGISSSASVAAHFDWLTLLPDNLFGALARGDTVQLAGCGVLLALAMRRSGEIGEWVASAIEKVARVFFELTGLLVRFTPLAALGSAAAFAARHQLSTLADLAGFAGVVAVGLVILGLVITPTLLLSHGIPIRATWRAARPAVLLGFSTASGAVALPVAIASLEERQLAAPVVRLIYPLAAIFNLAGSCLFMGAASVFLLNATDRPPSMETLVHLFVLLMILGKAIPAVPRGSLALIATSITAVGLEPTTVAAGIGLLLSIDAIFDMTRTAVQIWGHFALVTIIARSRYAGSMIGQQSARQ